MGDSVSPDHDEDEIYKLYGKYFQNIGRKNLLASFSQEEPRSIPSSETSVIDGLKEQYPPATPPRITDSLRIHNFMRTILERMKPLDGNLPVGSLSIDELNDANEAAKRLDQAARANTLPLPAAEINEMIPVKTDEYFRFLGSLGVGQNALSKMSDATFKTKVQYIEAHGRESNSFTKRPSFSGEERGNITLSSEVLIGKYERLKELLQETAHGSIFTDNDAFDLAFTWLSAHEYTHLFHEAVGRVKLFDACADAAISVTVFPEGAAHYQFENERQAEGFAIAAIGFRLREILEQKKVDVATVVVDHVLDSVMNDRQYGRGVGYDMAELVPVKQSRPYGLDHVLGTYIRGTFGYDNKEKYEEYKPLLHWIFNTNIPQDLGRRLPYKRAEVVRIAQVIQQICF